MIASETQSPGSSTRRQGTVRWMPPEMLKDSLFEPQYLLARDIYSFGCTILEVRLLSGCETFLNQELLDLYRTTAILTFEIRWLHHREPVLR